MNNSIIRNEHGLVSVLPTVNQTVFSRFASAREFTVMQVMACINQQLSQPDQVTIVQVSSALTRIALADDRIRRMAAGRYTWAWACGPRGIEALNSDALQTSH